MMAGTNTVSTMPMPTTNDPCLSNTMKTSTNVDDQCIRILLDTMMTSPSSGNKNQLISCLFRRKKICLSFDDSIN